jgi:LacI family transcriptional regulator
MCRGKVMTKRTEKSRMPTIRDVATRSGFSASTVSIVLNRAPLARYIRKDTKLHIEAVAKQLGYSPNLIARSLRNQRNHAVGVMVFDITDPFCTPILRGIEASLFQANFVPILADAHNDRGRFERALEMLLEQRVEGLIVIANWLCVDINILSDIEKRKIPTVIVGRDLADSISSVQVDNVLGARLALEHLHTLGHRKVAFIRGPKMLADSNQRWKGIRNFAATAGMKIEPALVLELPNLLYPMHGFEAGYNKTMDLLETGRTFTAISAFDDVTALGAIKALRKVGRRVPEQCSVIGFDDTTPAAVSAPSLTTVRQPMESMGTVAAQLILETSAAVARKMEVASSSHRLLAPELVVRESTAAPPKITGQN